MRIISFAKLRAYFIKHADSKTALEDWNQRAKRGQWKDFADVKKTFNSVDAIGNNRYVFNIKGNNYRVVALILFNLKRLYIRWVGTHAEYDKLKNIDKL